MRLIYPDKYTCKGRRENVPRGRTDRRFGWLKTVPPGVSMVYDSVSS